MRRNDREITEKDDIIKIISRCQIINIAMSDGDVPYIVTVNFGFSDENELELYFHTAKEGKKIDVLKKNPRIAFNMISKYSTKTADLACRWGAFYESVSGEGVASFAQDWEKCGFFDRIMKQAGCNFQPIYDEESLNRTEIVKIKVTKITGKANLK